MKNKIFIPFLDGLLSYDCKECPYNCCQSGNFITIGLKEKKILKRYPYLKYFFSDKNSRAYRLKRYGECWFINDKGLCDIHARFGYSFKPFVCQLHPFYIFKCGDEYVVSVLECYGLRVGKGGENTSHKLILRNARKAANYGLISARMGWSKKRLNLEKKILEVSRDFLSDSNYLNFSAEQLLMTTKTRDVTKIKCDLLRSVELWKSFLKVDDLNMENKKITHALVALTPLVRLLSIFNRTNLNLIPKALSALYFYLLLSSKVYKSKACHLTTCLEISDDISLSLLLLKKEDLSLKISSIEDRMRCLRLLQKLRARKLLE